jgi:hypothetical protein
MGIVIRSQFSGKEPKTFLLEVVVIGEDVSDSFATHGLHGDAVGKAVAFVAPIQIKIQTRCKGYARLRYHAGI